MWVPLEVPGRMCPRHDPQTWPRRKHCGSERVWALELDSTSDTGNPVSTLPLPCWWPWANWASLSFIVCENRPIDFKECYSRENPCIAMARAPVTSQGYRWSTFSKWRCLFVSTKQLPWKCPLHTFAFRDWRDQSSRGKTVDTPACNGCQFPFMQS